MANILKTVTSDIQVKQFADQSVFVKAAVSGVVREGVIAAALTALMILLFLGSWVLHNPAVTAAIVGARNARQVEQNVGAAELNLTDNDIAEIEGRKVSEPQPATQQLETNYEQLSQ